MRVLALWVVNYASGSASERFIKPLQELGHSVDVIALEEGRVEERLTEAVMYKEYDLLLHLPYPGTVRMEVIRSLPITTIAWCGDDEWFWHVYPREAQAIADSHEYCITTHKPAMGRYRHPILASWGYSPKWNRRACKKDIDIYFCGSRNEFRDGYIQSLRNSGFKVIADGPGYGGKISLDDMILRYRRAKIGLSFLSEQKGDFYYKQIKARTFEIPALGTFQLSEYCDELSNYFKLGEEIETFSSERELFDKCEKYLKREKDRELIAFRGFQRNKRYSYFNIFRSVFKQIEMDYYA